MAQSRMAGMAMDLGPSDLADVGEAATLATNKMGMEQGQSATHIMDLDAGHHQYVNDGRPVMMIKRNSEVRGMRDVGSALPIKGERMGAERFVPISPQGRNAGNKAFNSGRMDHVGYYN